MDPPEAGPKVDGVRVAVRVRPLMEREKTQSADSPLAWRVTDAEIAQSYAGKPVPANSFLFDHVFNQVSTNEQVFDSLARPIVHAAIEGYNSCCFAYGQSSSGKTFSMGGTASDPGVTRRSVKEVFALVGATGDRQFCLRASYIEIYQEIIRDLLEPSHDNLKIHEDINRRVYVESREEVVSSVNEVMRLLEAGEAVRAVGETGLNDRSSRSHTIFTLIIESRALVDEAVEAAGEGVEAVDSGIAVRSSTLSLVDLAGSERANMTGAEGVRLKEGSHINKSLLTLGTVINKLSSAEPGATAHIPYRDSKLTRILQPALGGNARTVILCAVTPATMHMDETLSTLKFASRAKKVKNRTQCNEFLDDTAKLRRCEKKLLELKKLLAAASSGTPVEAGGEGQASEEAVKAAAERRIAAFGRMFASFNQTTEAPSSGSPIGGFQSNSSSSSRDALDLALPSSQLRAKGVIAGSAGGAELSESAEEEIANCRRLVFAAEQASARLVAEMNYERKAMQAEVTMLSEVSEEATKSRSAAEDDCEEAMSALAKAQSSALVDEMISSAMLSSDANKELRVVEERVMALERMEKQASDLKVKLAATEKDLTETRRREKRGVGPVLKEVDMLKRKLRDAENKLKSNRQTSSKTASEKAGVERDMKAKSRQIQALETELKKYRQKENQASSRTEKEVAAERQKTQTLKEETDAEIADLSSRLDLSSKQVSDLQADVIRWEGENDSACLQLLVSKTESQKLSEQVQSLEEKLKLTDADIDEAKSKLDVVREESSAALAVAAEDSKRLIEEQSRLVGELEVSRSDVEELNVAMKDMQDKHMEVVNGMESATSEFELFKLESEVVATETQKAVSKLEKELIEQSEVAAKHQKESAELGTELAELRTQAEIVRAENTEASEKLESTLKELTEKREMIQSLEQEIELKALSMEEVQEKSRLALDAAHVEFSALSEKLEKEREAKFGSMDEIQKETQSLLEETKTECKSLKAELEESRKLNTELASTATKKSSEFEASTQEAQTLLEEAKAECKSLEAELEESRKLAAEVTAIEKSSEFEASAQEAQSLLEKAKAECKSLNAELHEALRLAGEVESTATKKSSELKSSTEEAQSLLEEAKAECKSLNAELDEARRLASEAASAATGKSSQFENSTQERERNLAAKISDAQLELEVEQKRGSFLSERIGELGCKSCSDCPKQASRIAELERILKKTGHDLEAQKEDVRLTREALRADNELRDAEVAKEALISSKRLEKVYERDQRIGELEDKLAQYRRGGGAIERLEKKLQRRNAAVSQLQAVLETNEAWIKKELDPQLAEQWASLERATIAEAELETSRSETKEALELIAKFEEREVAGQVERRQLRHEIKTRDLARQKSRGERLQKPLLERNGT